MYVQGHTQSTPKCPVLGQIPRERWQLVRSSGDPVKQTVPPFDS